MAVNLKALDPKALHAVAGVTLGVAEAGIRKAGRKDLLVIRIEDGARVAGVFTRNRFFASLRRSSMVTTPCISPPPCACRHSGESQNPC